MENKRNRLGLAWLLLGLVINHVGAQENTAGVQQGVNLVETRADDHSGTNEPPRDKRFFQLSRFNHPQQFQPTVSFDQLNNYNHKNYNQPQNQFGGRTRANNQYFNTFNQFRNYNGRTGNRPMNNMWPRGYGDWSQWGWPSNDGFWGRSYGSWGQQNQWGPWRGGQAGGNSGSQWNQFGGRSVSGPRNQFGGRSVSGPRSQFGGRSGGNWPSYSYGYGYPYGFRK